jgi:D-sedoheptulose 7-phosphate isomerase
VVSVHTARQQDRKISPVIRTESEMNSDGYLMMQSYLSDISSTLHALPLGQIAEVIQTLDRARKHGRRVYIFGNGGSAATASHFACDLAKGTITQGTPRFKVFSLTDGTPLVSAWANDTDYSNVFTEQLKNYVEPNDVVVAISGSGNSRNVLNAVEEARLRGAITIGFSGFDGGRLNTLADIGVVVPNYTMEQVEDVHLILTHLIATLLRNQYLNKICVTNDVGVLQNMAEQFIKQRVSL